MLILLLEWGGRGLRLIFNSKDVFMYFMKELGLIYGRGKCSKVQIPNIFYDDKKHILRLVRGIFDTDGTIFTSKKPGVLKYPTIELTTTSQVLANQIKKILSENGFRANIRVFIYKNRNVLPSYKVSMYGNINVLRWYEKVGFSNPLKKKRLLETVKMAKNGTAEI